MPDEPILPLDRPATEPGYGWSRPARWVLGGVMAGLAMATVMLSVAPSIFLTADEAAMRSGQKLPQGFVGVLADAQGNGRYVVSSLRHGSVLTVKAIGPVDAPAPGERLLLWAVPQGAPPFVLGEAPLQGSTTTRLPATAEKLLAKVGTLVASAEKSATPQAPTRILYSGACAKLW
ncbi:anti-sigma factor domain-containing protein [Ramlibacter sp.]|uniref:anti-sigma factor domain-containing protein n=1 Tax=Ramlibacter sp. TaxID=1917967 RepID=UPI003D0B441A